MQPAATIDEVINQLNLVIQHSKQSNSRIGYFATLYKRMTLAVNQGIKNGSFEDGPRMEKLDVIFANRYLSAWNAYINKQPCPNAWCRAFDASKQSNLTVLQHLLLGINTHINLDLCIAAAETSPQKAIYSLQNDFNKINQVIAAESQKVQIILERIWPPLKLLAHICNNKEQAVINFSIDIARKVSWENAVLLATADDAFEKQLLNRIENSVVEIGGRIISPGFMLSLLLKPVNWMENKSVAKLIDVLEAN